MAQAAEISHPRDMFQTSQMLRIMPTEKPP
jgi:hypothetical protein